MPEEDILRLASKTPELFSFLFNLILIILVVAAVWFLAPTARRLFRGLGYWIKTGKWRNSR